MELLAHWGYENDPAVVAEVLGALEARRLGMLVNSTADH